MPAVGPDKPSDHTPDVAPPPIDPPRAPVVPPWQIAVIVPPASTVGTELIVNILFAEVVPHDPPLVERVKVIVGGADAEAV